MVEVGVHDIRKFSDGGRITLNNDEFDCAERLAAAYERLLRNARTGVGYAITAAIQEIDAIEAEKEKRT
jgi:hypothetical protein